MVPQPLRITSRPEQLREGLFGGVLLFAFEILPFLKENRIQPDWDVRALHYGEPPECRVIPAAVELNYPVEPLVRKKRGLIYLHSRHAVALGNNWPELNALWSEYFRIPDRIVAAADGFDAFTEGALGVHYRGNDKITPRDAHSNPVAHADFLAVIEDFLLQRPHFQRIFLATDDYSFFQFLRDRLPLEVVNLGEVGFHKSQTDSRDNKTDRALLDCVLLSRCSAVLITSSALSSFAKVLNPEVEIYRVAASRLFAPVPYFPVSYIPPYQPRSPQVRDIVDRLMEDDWTQRPEAAQFHREFTYQSRNTSLRQHWRIMMRNEWKTVKAHVLKPALQRARRTRRRTPQE
jgi:hypothetical protein